MTAPYANIAQGGTAHGQSVVTKTLAYNITDDDDVILVDATGGGVVVTLPAVTTWRLDREFVVKKIDSTAAVVDIQCAGGGTIDGQSPFSIRTQYGAAHVKCGTTGDNKYWVIADAAGGGTPGVSQTRAVNTTLPLQGGGNLTVDRTLSILDFVASGASHARGAVPDPGAVAGATKFLREDGTWAVPAGVVTGNIKWQPDTITSLLTTELNALAAGNGSGLGTEYNNLTNLFLFGMFQLDVTFVTGPTADTTVDLFLVPATDGTNYNNGSATVLPQNFCIGSWSMRNVNTQQLVSLWGIQLPPTKFKLLAFNNTNQAFPATGSTVKMVAYGGQLA